MPHRLKMIVNFLQPFLYTGCRLEIGSCDSVVPWFIPDKSELGIVKPIERAWSLKLVREMHNGTPRFAIF